MQDYYRGFEVFCLQSRATDLGFSLHRNGWGFGFRVLARKEVETKT